MAVAVVSGSPGQVYTNFVSTQTLSVNVGSNDGRFVVGLASSTTGDGPGSRSITSATYGGNALTISSVGTQDYGLFYQLVYGYTTLTGANNLVVNATNNSGGILLSGCAFDGVDSGAPISGVTLAKNVDTSATWTVSSATGDLVAALLMLTDTTTSTPQDAAVAISGFSTFPSFTLKAAGMTEAGAASVTINATLSGTDTWFGGAFSLKAVVEEEEEIALMGQACL
jgi:hypothetical protein